MGRLQSLCTIIDYLSAWIENQNRTPTDRCAFDNNIWPVIKEGMNELTETAILDERLLPTSSNSFI